MQLLMVYVGLGPALPSISSELRHVIWYYYCDKLLGFLAVLCRLPFLWIGFAWSWRNLGLMRRVGFHDQNWLPTDLLEPPHSVMWGKLHSMVRTLWYRRVGSSCDSHFMTPVDPIYPLENVTRS